MLPDALPQLLDTLLRLPLLEAAQLRELIQRLPDPQAAAEEMVRRGWITQNQFSSVFPDPQRPTPQEMMLIGFDDDERPSDASCDDWGLTLSDDEDEAVPVITGAASTPPLQSAVPAPFVADGNEAHQRAIGTSRHRSPWAGKGLLMCIMCLVGFFAGLQFFAAKSTVPPVARQDPPRAVDLPLMLNPINVAITKQYEEVIKRITQNTQTAAPMAIRPAVPVADQALVTAQVPLTAKALTRPNDAQPRSAPSLYDRVRQVVLENKTEETERLGIGDIAYRDVPNDGSIMVGMEVTYAPLFNHNLIKSVRAIYQRPNGTRYDGPVCGNPTGASERVVAKQGYAIGGATIRSGMGIDAIQLTFMEIGAEGLNPDKSYLSKWLDSDGGSGARTFVNDGRPIVGIAGMRSNDSKSWGPAFCLCLVTTRTGALAAADGQSMLQAQAQIDLQVPVQRPQQ